MGKNIMKIPFVDLKAQYRSIKDDVDKAISDVIENTAFILGEDVKNLEKDFAGYCNAKYAVGVGNGTDALYLALRAHDIGIGDEVITVPNTFIATTEAITLTGAGIGFVDIDPETCNMDPGKLEEYLEKHSGMPAKPKALIPVHLYGQPVDMDPINQIADKYNLVVIEDAAQAHGAEYKQRRVGSLGNAACFSFFPGKNLGAYGDGGMVVTNDEKIHEKVLRLRNHGRTKKYLHEFEGVNSRLDNLQAAILLVKLKKLDRWNENRRRNAKKYDDLLSKVKGVTIPKIKDGNSSVYHLYVIQVDERDKLKDFLSEKGIASGIHYPVPLHLQPAYSYLGLKEGAFPDAERISKRILSLPMFPELSDDQIERVVKAIEEFFQT